ncbi:MAG: glycoside hydrolase family 10 protein [Bacillota bacterium]
MMKNKTKLIITIFTIIFLAVNSLPTAAVFKPEQMRPVLMKIREAEREIGRAEREINKAELEFKLYNEEQAEYFLSESKQYLQKAVELYENNRDDEVEAAAVRAVEMADRAKLQTLESYPVQFRAFWLDNGTTAAAGGREGIVELLNMAEMANFNAVIPEVFFKGKTIIPDNELFIQDERFETWTEDPLEVIIEEAKKRNMEVHAWVWVFNENTHGEPGIILQEHPEWASRDKNGNIVTYHNSSWLSPSRADVREFLIKRFSYLAKNYDLAGINLDYIRFPEEYRASYGFDENTAALFEETTGINPFEIKSGSSESAQWNKFRESLITQMVEETSAELKNIDSELKISADVIPGREEARYRALQNWSLWLKEGYLDFVLPMTYTENLFSELSKWVEEDTEVLDYPIYPGISVFKLSPGQVIEQVDEINNLNREGMSLFAAAHLSEEHYRLLGEGSFREKAQLPYRDRAGAEKKILDMIKSRINIILEKEGENNKSNNFLDDLNGNLGSEQEFLNYLKNLNIDSGSKKLKSDFNYLQDFKKSLNKRES